MSSSLLKPSHPIVFIRHGETSWNREARFQGTTQTSISDEGAEQAYQNALAIQNLIKAGKLGLNLVGLTTSPLDRARQSANIISAELGLEQEGTIIDDRLREISMGRWEGLTSQQVKDTHYQERKLRKVDAWNFAPVGGESLNSRLPDVESFLADVRPNSVVVTHAGILRIVLHLLAGIPQQDAARATIPHTGLLKWDGDILHTLPPVTAT